MESKRTLFGMGIPLLDNSAIVDDKLLQKSKEIGTINNLEYIAGGNTPDLNNQAHVSPDTTDDMLEGFIGTITTDNCISFTDDEIPAEGIRHNKALYISVKYKEFRMTKVLIDNGSSLNVMPFSTFRMLSIDPTYMNSSSIIARAFDGTQRAVMGEIKIPIQIGPITFPILFQVMNIAPTYSCLLGRPWIHFAKAVPSTLHQKVKFIDDDRVVSISSDENLLVNTSPSTPNIEAAEEVLETVFHAFEIVNATYVEEGAEILKPYPGRASIM